MIEKLDLEPGTWVQVWGQVEDAAGHPEDTAVRMESHSEHYVAHVRNDRIRVPLEPPGFSRQCTSLYQREDGGPLWRCESFERHPKKHFVTLPNGKVKWDDSEIAGYFEER